MAGVPKILGAFKSLKVAFPTTLNVIGNAALAGVLFGLETLLDKTRPCPCDPVLNRGHVAVVFAVPAVILLMVSLMALPDSRKLLKCWTGYRQHGQSQEATACACCCWKQCHFTLITLLKAFMPPFIWIILLLLDGDHYACIYQEPSSGPDDTQSCKEICKHNPTPQQSRRCLQSWEIGGILLAGSVCLLVILHILPTCKCGGCTLDGYYKTKYKRKLEKAIEIKMKEKMKAKIAACADVEAEKLMNDLELSETGQKEQKPTQSPSNMELEGRLLH